MYVFLALSIFPSKGQTMLAIIEYFPFPWYAGTFSSDLDFNYYPAPNLDRLPSDSSDQDLQKQLSSGLHICS